MRSLRLIGMSRRAAVSMYFCEMAFLTLGGSFSQNLYGARWIPVSVIIAAIRELSVTSKAGL